jgi:hypothetical protein
MSADGVKPRPLNLKRRPQASTKRIEDERIVYLGTRQHNFTRHKYEQHDLRLDHAVDETREKLR